jgi:hypothetical protein
MTLFTFAIAGSVLALVMMLGGMVWLGARKQLEMRRMDAQEAGDLVQRGWRGRPGWTWFRGLGDGLSFYAEKPTKEIIQLLREGRWSEGLPWATPALGALLAFFFWSLLVGILVGAKGFWLWAMVLFFFGFAVAAAWPRDETDDDSDADNF